MPRYRLTVEYDGGPYVGWQRQDNGPSIQQHLTEAIERFSGESVLVTGAGRTDAGVHARGQVAHVDMAKEWDAFRFGEALNYHLKPEPIAILDCVEAEADFHARFSATARSYRYLIVNRRAPLALDRGHALDIQRPLDAEAMHSAAQRLIGKHDFTTFRASICQAKSPVKTLSSLSVRREGDWLIVDAAAPSFLHHQVRNIVGTLILVGQGKWSEADLVAALEARDRAAGGPTAPPDGLYLMSVSYEGRRWDSEPRDEGTDDGA
jgi:tRNA pseudouridine38-40 synthase